MWYSLSAYQMSPNFELPVPHFCSEKSSVREAVDALALVFDEFVFLESLAEFVFAFATLVFLLELLSFAFSCEPMLANKTITTKSPIPTIPTTTTPPKIHQTAFDFLRGGG